MRCAPPVLRQRRLPPSLGKFPEGCGAARKRKQKQKKAGPRVEQEEDTQRNFSGEARLKFAIAKPVAGDESV